MALLFRLAILVALIGPTEAQELSPKFLDSSAIAFSRSMHKAVFNDQWAKADTVLATRRIAIPGDPLVPLAHAARLQAEMFAREDRAHEREMKRLLDSAQTALEQGFADASRADSARLYYMLGVCQTHRSLWEAKVGSTISAIKNGFRARDNFEAGMKLDSTFAELKLGLGAYRYWKSAKGGGLLRSIGLISDERKEGLEMVRLAAEKAEISPDAAKSTLIWMLLNEKQYKEASALAAELQKKYPLGTAFLWPLAESYQKSYQYRDALQTYLTLRERLLPRSGNQINLIKVDYEITTLARILDDNETLGLIERSFDEYSQNTPRKTRRKLAGKYRALKRL